MIDELCSFEERGAGTDAERRAANMLAGRLRAAGRRADVEPTFVRPSHALVGLIHVVAAIAASILSVSYPAPAFALALVAATALYFDLNTRLYVARRLLFRRASQNVVSPGSNPEAPLRLILVAHYDAARSGFIFGERSLRIARRLPPRARELVGPWRILFWAGMAALLPILGLRMAGIDATWVAAIQLIPTVLLIIAAFALADIALSKVVPGAYDNASGVAAVLSVAEELDAGRTELLDVWVVLTGAEEALGEGMRSFTRTHRNELDRERTVIVNVDSVSFGTVHYATSEGPVISTPMDPELIELCEALAAAGPAEHRALPRRFPLGTDALPAAIRGFRAITITGLDEGGLPPSWYHTHDDTPERVDAAALARATEFVAGLAALLDRELARRVGS